MVGADGRGLQPALCSGPPPCRCLVHIVRSASLKYSKIRQFQEHFQFDVCRHEVRYGCLREDSCHFAHSFIELRVWLLQQYSGGGGAGAGRGGMTDSRQGGASGVRGGGFLGITGRKGSALRDLSGLEDSGIFPLWLLPGEARWRRARQAERGSCFPGYLGGRRQVTSPH